MFKSKWIKCFTAGFITYFVVTAILELFGINTGIVRFMVFAIVLLISYFTILLYKNYKS